MIKNINKKEQIFNFLVKTTLRSKLTFPWKGWIFFALAKKDQGSVERRSQMLIRKDLTVCCRHYPVGLRPPPLLQEGELCIEFCLPTLPRPFHGHPFYRRGIVHRVLLANTTPSGFARHPFCKKGNCASSSACKHYPARYRGHHFVSAGNLPRNLPRNLL